MPGRKSLALGAFGLAMAVALNWTGLKSSSSDLLLERAWSANQDGPVDAEPWPGAGTTPVAKLRWHGSERFVLKGAGAEKFSQAPRWDQSSAAPGAFGETVVRVPQLSDAVATGDAIVAETPDGYLTVYRVVRIDRSADTPEHDPYERVLHLVAPGHVVTAAAERRVASSASISANWSSSSR